MTTKDLAQKLADRLASVPYKITDVGRYYICLVPTGPHSHFYRPVTVDRLAKGKLLVRSGNRVYECSARDLDVITASALRYEPPRGEGIVHVGYRSRRPC